MRSREKPTAPITNATTAAGAVGPVMPITEAVLAATPAETVARSPGTRSRDKPTTPATRTESPASASVDATKGRRSVSRRGSGELARNCTAAGLGTTGPLVRPPSTTTMVAIAESSAIAPGRTAATTPAASGSISPRTANRTSGAPTMSVTSSAA
ncbi:hypothetical protein SRABI02_03029 [Plantibacter cousiniae]|nr:hypothetical protein SRABI02_03029 [Plantibacter cousiniae]